MAKKKKASNSKKVSDRVDRISDLPTPLHHHILSFLPTQQVVQTCLLAKGWKNLWRSVPSLVFDYLFIKANNFSKFVGSLLSHQDDIDVEKLQLFLYREISDTPTVERLVMYAIQHNVFDIEIHWHKSYELAPLIFNCSTLRNLILSADFVSELHLPDVINVPKLKTLNLQSVGFHEQQQLRLFSSIPSLETLVIEGCCFTKYHLTISVPQIKNLVVSGVNLPEFFAPNLISLQVRNLSSVRICLNGYTFCVPNVYLYFPPEDSSEVMIQLFKLLNKNAHSMTVSALFLSSIVLELQKDFSILECILQTPFYDLTFLRIETLFSDVEMLVINTLLKHSPEIETIILENKMGGDRSDLPSTGKKFDVEKAWFKYKLARLETVEIQGFRGSDNEVKLAKFFLRKAINLKNMIITTSRSEDGALTDNLDMAKIGRELLQCRWPYCGVGILFV